ncbi:MAG: hypothetical protein A2107_15840 [Verrucomicrobia bacterium GWF2_62_7]|nr:MAG: hypothetical protein A2X32_11370 [Elusimicrobia bacterium GWC2_64_44]OHE75364.1 MAG: hypothetical protein A2107_15840 [Verrucomicrobia bacterium GWF2_62_7]
MAKILIVDDDVTNRDILRTRLESAGYEIAEAVNGEEGVNLAQQMPPDLIILDVMMPKVDGLLACRILKANDKTRSIPIVMLTARSQQMEELRGWESGADEYLTKPCDHQRLLAVVAQFLPAAGGKP